MPTEEIPPSALFKVAQDVRHGVVRGLRIATFSCVTGVTTNCQSKELALATFVLLITIRFTWGRNLNNIIQARHFGLDKANDHSGSPTERGQQPPKTMPSDDTPSKLLRVAQGVVVMLNLMLFVAWCACLLTMEFKEFSLMTCFFAFCVSLKKSFHLPVFIGPNGHSRPSEEQELAEFQADHGFWKRLTQSDGPAQQSRPGGSPSSSVTTTPGIGDNSDSKESTLNYEKLCVGEGTAIGCQRRHAWTQTAITIAPRDEGSCLEPVDRKQEADSPPAGASQNDSDTTTIMNDETDVEIGVPDHTTGADQLTDKPNQSDEEPHYLSHRGICRDDAMRLLPVITSVILDNTEGSPYSKVHYAFDQHAKGHPLELPPVPQQIAQACGELGIDSNAVWQEMVEQHLSFRVSRPEVLPAPAPSAATATPTFTGSAAVQALEASLTIGRKDPDATEEDKFHLADTNHAVEDKTHPPCYPRASQEDTEDWEFRYETSDSDDWTDTDYEVENETHPSSDLGVKQEDAKLVRAILESSTIGKVPRTADSETDDQVYRLSQFGVSQQDCERLWATVESSLLEKGEDGSSPCTQINNAIEEYLDADGPKEFEGPEVPQAVMLICRHVGIDSGQLWREILSTYTELKQEEIESAPLVRKTTSRSSAAKPLASGPAPTLASQGTTSRTQQPVPLGDLNLTAALGTGDSRGPDKPTGQGKGAGTVSGDTKEELTDEEIARKIRDDPTYHRLSSALTSALIDAVVVLKSQIEIGIRTDLPTIPQDVKRLGDEMGLPSERVWQYKLKQCWRKMLGEQVDELADHAAGAAEAAEAASASLTAAAAPPSGPDESPAVAPAATSAAGATGDNAQPQNQKKENRQTRRWREKQEKKEQKKKEAQERQNRAMQEQVSGERKRLVERFYGEEMAKVERTMKERNDAAMRERAKQLAVVQENIRAGRPMEEGVDMDVIKGTEE